MARKLLDRLRDKIRVMHYSPKTEDSYASWVKRFILFHNKRHPEEMGKLEIEAFLTFLAVKKKVSPTTQNQAFHAILFLYEKVLNVNLKDENIQALRAKQRIRIPVVLTETEVGAILDNLLGIYLLIVKTMYGCGLRLNEVLNLRIKDIDFGFNKVIIWDSKSLADRSVPIPQKIKDDLLLQVKHVEITHKIDLKNKHGSVFMPYALTKKYPNAKYETKWQYLFPMNDVSKDPKTGVIRRHHVLENTLSRNIKKAVTKSAIHKKVTSHTFRHSYATHLLQHGIDIRTIQDLMGHKSLVTTMIYTHVIKDLNKNNIPSPLDLLE
jgi:integron integrase